MPREKQMKNGHNSKINKNIPNQQTKRRAKLTLILQCCEWLCCFCQVIIQHIDWSNERIFRLLFSELARKRMYRCGSSLCVTHQIVVAANCTGTQHSVSVHLISRRRFSSDVEKLTGMKMYNAIVFFAVTRKRKSNKRSVIFRIGECRKWKQQNRTQSCLRITW